MTIKVELNGTLEYVTGGEPRDRAVLYESEGVIAIENLRVVQKDGSAGYTLDLVHERNGRGTAFVQEIFPVPQILFNGEVGDSLSLLDGNLLMFAAPGEG